MTDDTIARIRAISALADVTDERFTDAQVAKVAAFEAADVPAEVALFEAERRGEQRATRAIEALAGRWAQTADQYLALSRNTEEPPEHRQRAWDQYQTFREVAADLNRATLAGEDQALDHTEVTR